MPSLTKIAFFNYAGPILRINALLNIAVKSGIWPIFHLLNQAVFQRIDVHIIEMPVKIFFIANQMFPIMTLPNAAFTCLLPDGRAIFG